MTIADYLAARAARPAAPTPKARALAALIELAEAGAEIDALLTSAEHAKAAASRPEAGAFEETVQTLGALSREVWVAHTAALTVARAWDQLEDVEARLIP